jgi:hypothetical protein
MMVLTLRMNRTCRPSGRIQASALPAGSSTCRARVALP